MHSVTSNAVAQAIQGGGWQTLVYEQNGGSFTIPDDAKEILICITTDSLKLIGSSYCMTALLIDKNEYFIPCNDSAVSRWDISNNGKTFTFRTGGYRRVTVYYK